MALSGVVSKGLVGGSVGRPFARSISCGDLTSVPVGSRDGIQLFVATPGAAGPARVLASDAISSVNVKVKAPSGGLYSKSKCIDAGCSPSFDMLANDGRSTDSTRFVLGMSDLMFLSVSTASGKEYAFSSEHRVHATACPTYADSILEEGYSEDRIHGSELIPVLESPVAQKMEQAGADTNRTFGKDALHVVADRNKSKVFFRSGGKGSFLELSVMASPTVSRANSWNSEIVSPRSFLLEDAALVQENASAPEFALLAQVEEGLSRGHKPQLTEDGSGGTYFMADGAGHKAAVFKPVDEEPLALNNPRGMVPSSTGEGLKKGTRVGEGAVREVAAYLLDHPAVSSSDADEGFSGVPRTLLARCNREFFPASAESSVEADLFLPGMDTSKLGSLQQFVPAMSNCEDMGPQRFPVHEVHKIAVLDMRLGNADRNGANILVQQNGSDLKLIPIDHGYCLPETLEDCTFEWLYWPQAKAPFDEDSSAYAASLDAEEDIELLRQAGWAVSDAVALTLRACTMLLKKGAAKGLTPYQIGSLMVRQSLNQPSALESMIEEAEACVDWQALAPEVFIAVLGRIMDEELDTLTI